MENERVVISGRLSKRAKQIILGLAGILFVLGVIFMLSGIIKYCAPENKEIRLSIDDKSYKIGSYTEYEYLLSNPLFYYEHIHDVFWFGIFPTGIGFASSGLFVFLYYLMLRKMQIVVTDKRVYGKVWFGKSVDLPLDSVSSVGSTWIQGIAVGTSSGKISFIYIDKAKEIHSELRELIIERQEEAKKEVVKAEKQLKGPDEILKYKQLLDMGVITQEEFDKKKTELLDI